MLCATFFLLTSCDNTPDPIAKKYIPDTEQIAFRDPPDDCTDCPNGCCCCIIEILDPLNVDIVLSICGVCEGDYVCGTFSPPAPCSSVSGQGYDIDFTMISRRELCVPEGGSFRIFNNETFDVTITITCQHDIINPDTHIVTIQAGRSVFFVSDGDCFIDGPCI